jgi:hypothetical protein
MRILFWLENLRKLSFIPFIIHIFATKSTCMVTLKKIVSIFLVALFTSFYAGTTLFSHLHTISGATITHSHFHRNSHHDTKSGGHTERCITLIAQISKYHFIDFLCVSVPAPLQLTLHKGNIVETTHWIAPIHFQNISLRAPPMSGL